MTPGTINELFEYRMKHIIKQFLREIEEKPADGYEMFDLIDEHRPHFGLLVEDALCEWMSADEWFAILDK